MRLNRGPATRVRSLTGNHPAVLPSSPDTATPAGVLGELGGWLRDGAVIRRMAGLLILVIGLVALLLWLFPSLWIKVGGLEIGRQEPSAPVVVIRSCDETRWAVLATRPDMPVPPPAVAEPLDGARVMPWGLPS